MEKKIGFIGSGQMASALAGGFMKAGLVPPQNLYAYDVSESAAEKFRQSVGGTICGSLAGLVQFSDMIFLCVKPQHMDSVLEKLSPHTRYPIYSEFSRKEQFEIETIQVEPEPKETIPIDGKLFISIAAGLELEYFLEYLGENVPIVRVMPNTPCLLGSGACGWTPSESVSEEDAKTVQTLLETVGIAAQVPEKLLNAITGLSGSGPAFVYVMIEAMSDAGVRLGLPRKLATQFAAQTLKGAAEMVLQTGEHPGELKDRVASPAGTTIAGLVALENAGMRSAMINAVLAAANRAEELTK